MMFEWSLNIIKADNGYILESFEENEDGSKTKKQVVIQESETDELKAHQQLLWEIMEFFNFQGSKHDSERIRIIRENQNGQEIEDK